MDENRVTGMHIYYYYVCKRKLWYFSNGLAMESENENVKLGKLIDETTYKQNKKHIMIDNTINIDFISEHNLLHEVKKSRKVEEAGIAQLKYYIYYLKKRGVEGIRGRIDYPLLKQSINVELSEEDEKELESATADIIKIISADLPPQYENKRYANHVLIMICVVFEVIKCRRAITYIQQAT
ncbi:CRISPR-associated protein Cas4 [Ruminococcus sp.]|uniref:CRISPR-associated protein Cas4 n=1 Tax=Ruminococcus sp. TaxID=41978 RepID=UPI00345CB6EA